MDSTLQYVFSGAHGFLLLRPFMPDRLRPTLLEAQSGWCLSVVGSPPACLTGGPGPCPRSMREAGRVNRW
jgi:hypothetical protein